MEGKCRRNQYRNPFQEYGQNPESVHELIFYIENILSIQHNTMQTSYKIFFFCVLMISACAREAVVDTGFELAASTASEVNESIVWSHLEMVAASHTIDVKLDNEGYESSAEFPSEYLSRDSATGIIIRALTDMGYDADTVVLSGEDAHLAYNIVAEYPGTTKPDEVVLIGVHHDAFYTGADDNSSAVAGMLEMARVIRQHTFARTIRLVSFDLEDFGSIGSTRFVEAGYADDVVAAIVMDMIGYASNQPGSQKDVVGIRLPDIGDFLFVIGNQQSAEMTQQMVAMSNAHHIAKVLGVILNDTEGENDIASQTNPGMLEKYLDVPLLGIFPHTPDLFAKGVDREKLAGLFEKHIKCEPFLL